MYLPDRVAERLLVSVVPATPTTIVSFVARYFGFSKISITLFLGIVKLYTKYPCLTPVVKIPPTLPPR